MPSVALRVREEQVRVLRQASFEVLEDRTARILAQFFPEACARLGDERVRAFVQESVQRAEALGVTREVDQGKYVALEFSLGVEVMAALVASTRAALRAQGASEHASVLVGAVCRAGLRRLRGEDALPVEEEN